MVVVMKLVFYVVGAVFSLQPRRYCYLYGGVTDANTSSTGGGDKSKVSAHKQEEFPLLIEMVCILKVTFFKVIELFIDPTLFGSDDVFYSFLPHRMGDYYLHSAVRADHN